MQKDAAMPIAPHTPRSTGSGLAAASYPVSQAERDGDAFLERGKLDQAASAYQKAVPKVRSAMGRAASEALSAPAPRALAFKLACVQAARGNERGCDVLPQLDVTQTPVSVDWLHALGRVAVARKKPEVLRIMARALRGLGAQLEQDRIFPAVAKPDWQTFGTLLEEGMALRPLTCGRAMARQAFVAGRPVVARMLMAHLAPPTLSRAGLTPHQTALECVRQREEQFAAKVLSAVRKRIIAMGGDPETVFRYVREKAPLIINFDPANAKAMRHVGQYLTCFEGKLEDLNIYDDDGDGWNFGANMRKEQARVALGKRLSDETILGYPQSVDWPDRVSYGTLNAGKWWGGAPKYGLAMLVVRREVRHRATITPTDTYFGGYVGEKDVGTLQGPVAHVLHKLSNNHLQRIVDASRGLSLPIDTAMDTTLQPMGYENKCLEAQLHLRLDIHRHTARVDLRRETAWQVDPGHVDDMRPMNLHWRGPFFAPSKKRSDTFALMQRESWNVSGWLKHSGMFGKSTDFFSFHKGADQAFHYVITEVSAGQRDSVLMRIGAEGGQIVGHAALKNGEEFLVKTPLKVATARRYAATATDDPQSMVRAWNTQGIRACAMSWDPQSKHFTLVGEHAEEGRRPIEQRVLTMEGQEHNDQRAFHRATRDAKKQAPIAALALRKNTYVFVLDERPENRSAPVAALPQDG